MHITSFALALKKYKRVLCIPDLMKFSALKINLSNSINDTVIYYCVHISMHVDFTISISKFDQHKKR